MNEPPRGPSRYRISPEKIHQLLILLGRLLPFVPEKHRELAGTILGLVVAAFVIVAGTEYRETAGAERPMLATMLTDSQGDVNLIIDNGKVAVQEPKYTREHHQTDSHGGLGKWEAKANFAGVKTGVPGAPVMTWEFAPLRNRELIRHCFAEADTAGAHVGGQARRVVTETWQQVVALGGPNWVESCDNPHTMAGISAQRDCQSTAAVGCALYARFNQHMRITADITRLDERGIYSAYLHEYGHFLNLDHTLCEHGHHSNMSGLFTPSGPPCAANGEYRVSAEDLQDSATYYGWRKQEPTATVPPTATQPPTVAPTPSPTSPPLVAQQIQIWLYAPDRAGGCTIGGEGDWIVVTCQAPRFWTRFGPTGRETPFEFEE